MKEKRITVEESIRIEAYLLSEKAGHPSGMESYFWKEAEAIVHARASALAGAVKAVAAKKKKAPTKGKAESVPKAKAAAADKPKGAAKKVSSNGTGVREEQFSLDGNGAGTAAPRGRTPKK